jgi:kinesin family protein 6/9
MSSSSDGRTFKVSISYLEIYNEQLYDLLDLTTQPHELTIHENARTNVWVGGLKTVEVKSEAEALAQLFAGEANRVIGEHQLNRESSRSHSIFTLFIETRMPGESGDIFISKVNLVDLAGSERVSKTKSEGLVLKEAGHINKSLSILEQVILALGDKGRDHVPFRSSRLTHVLRDSLGGNCRTVLIANLWGDASQIDESLSTLRLAQRMSKITCDIVANIQEDQSAKSKQLQRQVLELQAELAMHDQMANRRDVAYGPYSEKQRQTLSKQVHQFLSSPSSESSIEPLELMSLRHVREILFCARDLYQKKGGGAGSYPSEKQDAPLPPAISAAVRAAAAAAAKGVELSDADCVGEEDGPSHYALAAPDHARPEVAIEGALSLSSPPPPKASSSHLSSPSTPSKSGPPKDRHEALELYRKGPGAQKAGLLDENKTRLRNGKKRAKDLGLSINSTKKDLDALKLRHDRLKEQRQGKEGAELDAEELEVVLQIKSLKQKYRDEFAELQMIKSEIDYSAQLVDACALEISQEFAAWHIAAYGCPVPSDADIEMGSEKDLEQEAQHDGAQPTPKETPSSKPPTGKPKIISTSVNPLLTPDISDPEAAAYYMAQKAMIESTTGVTHRPGSQKKTRDVAAFGATKH